MDAVVGEERVGLVIGFLYKLGHFWIIRKIGFYCAAGGITGVQPARKSNKILIATIAEPLSIVAHLVYYFRIGTEIVSVVQPCASPCFLRNAIFCLGRSRLWLLRYPAFFALRGKQLKNTSTRNHQAVNPTQSHFV